MPGANQALPALDEPGFTERARDGWETFSYYETYRDLFDNKECERIIDLHRASRLVIGKMWAGEGLTVRDSDLFWIPRNADTEWVFGRLWNAVTQYNSRYGFDLSESIGQAQLTRYQPGQHYQWHMDVGARQASLRKITAVVELTSNASAHGGGLEIFFGESVDNKVGLDIGDIALFPSFVMHRAAKVERGTRWSLVLWLNGSSPLR